MDLLDVSSAQILRRARRLVRWREPSLELQRPQLSPSRHPEPVSCPPQSAKNSKSPM